MHVMCVSAIAGHCLLQGEGNGLDSRAFEAEERLASRSVTHSWAMLASAPRKRRADENLS